VSNNTNDSIPSFLATGITVITVFICLTGLSKCVHWLDTDKPEFQIESQGNGQPDRLFIEKNIDGQIRKVYIMPKTP